MAKKKKSKKQPIVLQVTTPLTVNGQTLAKTMTEYMLRQGRKSGSVLGSYAGRNEIRAERGIPLVVDKNAWVRDILAALVRAGHLHCVYELGGNGETYTIAKPEDDDGDAPVAIPV